MAWLSSTKLKIGLLGLATGLGLTLASEVLSALRQLVFGEWADLGLAWNLIALLIASGATIGFGLFTVEQARPLFRTKAQLIPARAGYKATALIMTFSPLSAADVDRYAKSAKQRLAEAAGDTSALDRLLELFCKASPDRIPTDEAPFGGWAWQQPLRLIRHHRSQLHCIFLVLSHEANSQLKEFEAVVQPFLKPGSDVRLFDQPISLEDYDGLEPMIQSALRAATTRCVDRDVCIDITGGQKPWSALGVLATVNSGAVFAYVQTNPPNEVLHYDVQTKD
jgi:hypothetical protein